MKELAYATEFPNKNTHPELAFNNNPLVLQQKQQN